LLVLKKGKGNVEEFVVDALGLTLTLTLTPHVYKYDVIIGPRLPWFIPNLTANP